MKILFLPFLVSKAWSTNKQSVVNYLVASDSVRIREL